MTEKIEDLKYYSCREYDGPKTNIRLKNNYHKSNTNINSQKNIFKATYYHILYNFKSDPLFHIFGFIPSGFINTSLSTHKFSNRCHMLMLKDNSFKNVDTNSMVPSTILHRIANQISYSLNLGTGTPILINVINIISRFYWDRLIKFVANTDINATY